MLLLRVIDDRGAGAQHIIESVPYTIGRAATCNLRIEGMGVWDCHATIHLADGGKFVIRAESGALVLVNGASVGHAQLAAGDELSLGSARLVVSLAPARQKSLVPCEFALWTLLLVVIVAEAALIFAAP